ncbi:MAG: SPOR domain-containing protein [Sphingomonas sp.]|nr:SPOR domain-containing protein [Sphingomonas sp.]
MQATGGTESRDEDRLPWLETVEEDYVEDSSILRTVMFVLLGFAALAAIIFGVLLLQSGRPRKGTGALIEAQEGDYKVRPDAPGGMKVEGEGDTAFAISEGKAAGDAKIDLKAMPEAPVTGTPAVAGPDQGATPTGAAIPPSAGKLKPPPPMGSPKVTSVSAAPVGAVVQLGSFPEEGSANSAWVRASKRFSYLAPLGKSVERALVNGKTVYRLRVNAGSASAAAELCGKLKVAGEGCFIATN